MFYTHSMKFKITCYEFTQAIIMKKIRILLAEDHKLIRETWSFLLNGDPRFEVVAACGDSAVAITRAEKERPDIILMDINIEPLNGFQATTRILQVSPE